MDACNCYFRDPDGHELEFIGMLPGRARPGAGIVTYKEWEAKEGNLT